MSESNGKCLFPECKDDSVHRGLCRKHYQTAARLVQKQETTWEALEAAGKSEPTKQPQGRTSGWFLNTEPKP